MRRERVQLPRCHSLLALAAILLAITFAPQIACAQSAAPAAAEPATDSVPAFSDAARAAAQSDPVLQAMFTAVSYTHLDVYKRQI